MNAIVATTIVIALFLLRFMLPVAITVLFGMGMNRLTRNWYAEPEI